MVSRAERLARDKAKRDSNTAQKQKFDNAVAGKEIAGSSSSSSSSKKGKVTTVTLNDGVSVSDSIKEQKKQSAISRSGTNKTIRLREKLQFRDPQTKQLRDIERRQRAFDVEIQRQEEIKRQLKKQQDEAREQGHADNIASLQSQSNREYNTQFVQRGGNFKSRVKQGRQFSASKKRALSALAIQIQNAKNSDSTKYSNAETKALQKEIDEQDEVINFFEKEKKETKKDESNQRQGDFGTVDDSTQRKSIPRQSARFVSGAPVVQKTIRGFKDFFGIDKPKENKKIELKESLTIGEGKRSRFMPTSYETGTYSKQNKIGYDPNYLSTNDPSKKIKAPSSVGLTDATGKQITQPEIIETKTNRGIEGAKAMPENFFQLGKESVEAGAQDIEKREFGSYEPSELKKDIIISPIDAITREIKPSVALAQEQGFGKGAENYFGKTGEHLGKLGKDIQDDPLYWQSNIGSNIMLVFGLSWHDPKHKKYPQK